MNRCMRSIFWIGCILAILVSLLSAGAFAESASPSTVEAAVAQAENVTTTVKDTAATVGSVAAQAENVTDKANEAASAAGIAGAENVTESVKQVAETVGTVAAKVENATETATEVLATVGNVTGEAAEVTAPVAEEDAATVTEQAPAEEDLVNDTLVKFVTDARTYAVNNGKNAALATFGNKLGGFVNDKMYIFAYDYDGKALVLPYNPGTVGMNMISQTDSTGLRYIQQMRDIAKQGVGFVRYQEADVMNGGKVSEKVSYVTDVDGSYWIGAGVFQSEEETQPAPVVEAAEDLVSSAMDAGADESAENLTEAVNTVADAATAVTANITA